ncbi:MULTISPECIES: patatin-like phospholipase family protein [unclassified Fusibacter]|uniref:patatin-like phospholipase family protein n=1 Tax=unclassified Fusibacter TaxID=2624464 RepID=UPI0010108F90|nr:MULTISPECIES: patatin-like phospholipase family protein [unclassified Fusibacter]MCK8059850.1 patatin-like phospholipase family protein [Fusibacter sp. A2]NPE21652.1 patatin-like phospholipase family protein [Fusibacter sp. A1]RXV62056.1 patatin-like phospholipase family protein [Fusibacter sp. A1]
MRALVLEGGGAKGAYHVGAWKALDERGEKFDIVTGTSIGALNGSLYAQGDLELAIDLWSNLSAEQVVAGDTELLEKLINFNVTSEDFLPAIYYLRSVIGKMGLDISPLRKLVKDTIDEEKVRNSKTKLGIVTVSLTDFKPIEVGIDEIPKDLLHEYLLASANLPIFKMNRTQGKIYIDGGFYDNLPINLAKRMGATSFTTIELGAIGIKRIPKNIERRRIVPVDNVGKILEFTTDNAKKNLKLGYFDAIKVMDEQLGIRYYIEKAVDDKHVFESLMGLDKMALSNLARVMGYDGMDPRRFTFEKLTPHLAEMLGLDSKSSYTEILIALLENIGDSVGMERFKVRKMSDWIQEIHNLYKPGGIRTNELNLFEKMFFQVNVMSDAQRNIFYKTVYEKLMYEVKL